MSSTSQILANRLDAERPTGPVTAEAKARVFSVTNFVRPEEQAIFAEFEAGYFDELSPATPLEQTLAREIIQAAWRLRRCADLESNTPENATEEDLDGLQASIDRARTTAQRTLHRSLAELRRLQTTRLYRTIAAPGDVIKQAAATDAALLNQVQRNFAKQTQPQLEKAVAVPRSAPCPCGSGEKYKRCCGKNAPPVLFAHPFHGVA